MTNGAPEETGGLECEAETCALVLRRKTKLMQAAGRQPSLMGKVKLPALQIMENKGLSA